MRRSTRTLLIVLGATALVIRVGGAQEKSGSLRLPVRADSRLWLEGTSNVRDWTCKATSMEALIAIDARSADSHDDVAVAKSLRGVDVIVPIRMLKCGDRHMEPNMYHALKAPEPPATSYIVADFELAPSLTDDGLTIEATGKMSIAGAERREAAARVRVLEVPLR